MTKSDVIKAIVLRTGLNKDVVGPILESFFDVVKDSLTQGETIFVRGFGSFGPKEKAEKKARHIKNNTSIVIPRHSVPHFKPSREFIDQVRVQTAVEA